jgi:hypothetical protein
VEEDSLMTEYVNKKNRRMVVTVDTAETDTVIMSPEWGKIVVSEGNLIVSPYLPEAKFTQFSITPEDFSIFYGLWDGVIEPEDDDELETEEGFELETDEFEDNRPVEELEEPNETA